MAAYRVIASDLRTGTRIAELQLDGLTYGSLLNDAGELSGTLALPSESNPTHLATLNDAVDEVRRQLVVERDSVPVWCGIVWAAPYDDRTQTRNVRAAETWSYYRRRTIQTRRVFNNVDQLVIARTLLDDAHGVDGGDIGVTTGSQDSDRRRDRTYEIFERKQLGEAVEQLAAVIDGFDFGIDPTYTPNGDLVKTFNLEHPRRGVPAAQSNLVFEVGRNVIEWEWPTDGTRYANRVHNIGSGEGADTLLATRTAASQLVPVADGGPGFPMIEEVLSNVEVTRLSTLNDQAQAALNAYSVPVVLPRVVVRADSDPIFGTYRVGDGCRFIVEPGLSPRFPDGLDTLRRIVGWEVSVDGDGTESVSLLLGEEPNG